MVAWALNFSKMCVTFLRRTKVQQKHRKFEFIVRCVCLWREEERALCIGQLSAWVLALFVSLFMTVLTFCAQSLFVFSLGFLQWPIKSWPNKKHSLFLLNLALYLLESVEGTSMGEQYCLSDTIGTIGPCFISFRLPFFSPVHYLWHSFSTKLSCFSFTVVLFLFNLSCRTM